MNLDWYDGRGDRFEFASEMVISCTNILSLKAYITTYKIRKFSFAQRSFSCSSFRTHRCASA